MKTTIVIALAAFAVVTFGQIVVANETTGHGHMMINQSMPMMSTMHSMDKMRQSNMQNGTMGMDNGVSPMMQMMMQQMLEHEAVREENTSK